MGSAILETISRPDLVLAGHGRELLALKHHDQNHVLLRYKGEKIIGLTILHFSERQRKSKP